MSATSTTADGTKKGTILCIASYEKGQDFMRSAKQCGWTVILLTSQSLKDEADWPHESLDEIYYMPDKDKKWDVEETRRAVSYLARTKVFDRIVPLDDFDLETAAMIREHLRVPGMGDTTTRYFRDKLAMRVRALSEGLRVPEFVHLLNDAAINAFADSVPTPWVVKPRFLAGALGIKKAHSKDELWRIIDKLGDERATYVLERFVPGDIFHVDSLTHEGRILFQRASKYGKPPLEVSHTGDIFTSRILPPGTDDARALVKMNTEVLQAMRLVRGASHSEFIRGRDDGLFYFLETSARVGGAHLADMVDAATGINLWAEWAKIEIAGEGGAYSLPLARDEYAGILVSLAKQEWPNTGSYDAPEVVWRLHKKYHAGLIVRSPSPVRIEELLVTYVDRFRDEFHAVHPPQEG